MTSGRYYKYVPRAAGGEGAVYSSVVRGLKIVLPLLFLALVGVVLARLSGDPKEALVEELPAAEKTTPGQIELIEATYEGVDEAGRRYSISADKAVRDVEHPNAVSFENPLADITLEDGTWLALKAKGGGFDKDASTLTLDQGVSIFHDAGYEIKLDDIVIDLQTRAAKTDHAVFLQGPLGTLRAQNLSVTDSGNVFLFGGPVTLTLHGFDWGRG